MPTPSQDRKSAAFYLRGNVMVGVDLDPSIPVSGKLPVPNQSLQRSAITPYGCPPAGQLDRRSSTSTGHHIEINLDTRELARLVLPVTVLPWDTHSSPLPNSSCRPEASNSSLLAARRELQAPLLAAEIGCPQRAP